MRGRKPRQHRVALQEHVRRQPRVPIEGRQSRSVSIVPRGEGGNDDAGVDRQHQRRTLSKVARTRSSVRSGNSRSGTETRRPFRLSSRIGVAAGSISMAPSRSRISIGRSPDRPRASRIDFGMTTRPAASMVIRMAREYDRTLARLPPLASGGIRVVDGGLARGAAAAGGAADIVLALVFQTIIGVLSFFYMIKSQLLQRSAPTAAARDHAPTRPRPDGNGADARDEPTPQTLPFHCRITPACRPDSCPAGGVWPRGT